MNDITREEEIPDFLIRTAEILTNQGRNKSVLENKIIKLTKINKENELIGIENSNKIEQLINKNEELLSRIQTQNESIKKLEKKLEFEKNEKLKIYLKLKNNRDYQNKIEKNYINFKQQLRRICIDNFGTEYVNDDMVFEKKYKVPESLNEIKEDYLPTPTVRKTENLSDHDISFDDETSTPLRSSYSPLRTPRYKSLSPSPKSRNDSYSIDSDEEEKEDETVTVKFFYNNNVMGNNNNRQNHMNNEERVFVGSFNKNMRMEELVEIYEKKMFGSTTPGSLHRCRYYHEGVLMLDYGMRLHQIAGDRVTGPVLDVVRIEVRSF